MRTGSPIVYTSADSVFQIAAHEDDHPGPRAVPGVRDRLRHHGRGAIGLGRIIARPFVGAPGLVPPDVEPARLRDAAGGRDAARPADGRRRPGRSPSARSRTCSPGRASPSRCTPRRDDDGMDQVERAMAERAARPDLRQPRRLRHRLRPPEQRRGLRDEPRAVRRAARPSCCRACGRTTCWC